MLGGTPASVLKPRTGNYEEIRALNTNIFASSDATALAPSASPTEQEPTPTSSPEPVVLPSVEIRNGTNITGLAKETSEELASEGYEIITIGNAASRDIQTTTIYALSDDAVSAAKTLADQLNAQTDSGLPSEEPSSSADLLIILGQDAE